MNITGLSSTTRVWHAALGLLVMAGLSTLYHRAESKHTGAERPSPSVELLRVAPDKSAGDGRHALDDAIDFIEPSRKMLETVKDYTAVFTKSELLDGRILTQTMDMKFRQHPFSVYLRCHSKRGDGREVLFVAGRYDGKLLVRESGLKAIVGTMELELWDPKVMDVNRYQITEIGMTQLLESALKIWNTEKKTLDPRNLAVGFARSVTVGDVECEAVEIAHRAPQPGLTYQVGRVYLDKKSRLPVRAEMYGWPAKPGDEPPLLEQYTYSNVQLNVGLTDADFDRHNGGYRFDIR